ncbi:MAG: ATP-binding cassette domain-containing protein [Deltaproteobacteria bacterium]|nr:ATP-binding cassette domain-containing protein [Deltaproteobacteria bacterium]
MIQVQHITKAFAGHTAVSDVSFDVEAGEILGFLGPNGAGKTTTMRVVTGFLPPTHGTVVVGGYDVVTAPLAVKSLIGYLPEHVPLHPEMRVSEYLSFRAALKGVARAKVGRAVERAIEECIIGDVRGRVIGQLSKGYRQRVGLADALVSDPPILILDEPTIGLDPTQIREVRKLIKELGRKRTVVLSSHILPEVEAVCDRVVIISRGRLVGEGTPEELKRQLEGKVGAQAEVRAADFDPAAFESVAGGCSVESEALEDDVHRVVITAGEEAGAVEEEVFLVCVERGWVLRELKKTHVSLEDIFVEIVAREDHADREADEEPDEEPDKEADKEADEEPGEEES